MATRRTLDNIRTKLVALHGEDHGPGFDDPFQLVLWEQVAYLADDDKRSAAFALLKRKVGLTPAAILEAKAKTLVEIARAGGSIGAPQRGKRMQDSARRVRDEWGGDLRAVLDLPGDKAVRALTRFPMIGRPGAEKILLLTRTHPVLALDSNALRVLLRLGYGEEDPRYERTYASVRAATARQERADFDWMIPLAGALRRHGQEICRNRRPDCPRCPLTAMCGFFADHAEG